MIWGHPLPGAALHFVDGKHGVKDFDVWTFYATHPEGMFPPRWHAVADFGRSRFGGRRRESDGLSLDGRRVDLFGRSLPEHRNVDAVEALRRYFGGHGMRSTRELAKKAAVIIDPPKLRGTVVWRPATIESFARRPDPRSREITGVAQRALRFQ